MKHLLLVGLAIISPLSFAADMSSWSDKTVCRLVTTQTDNQAYLDEASSRGIKCASSSSSKTNSITAKKGFDSLTYKAQSILNYLGHTSTKPNGRWSTDTEQALSSFLSKQNQALEGSLNDNHIALLEEAYKAKTGDFPLFGSKGVDLPLLMPKALPDTDNGWNELLKTELHRIDISNANFSALNFANYQRAAQSGSIYDPYLIGMIKGSSCYDINYNFKIKKDDPPIGAWCNFVLRKLLPTVGHQPIQDVLNHWAANPVEDYAPNYRPNTDNVYTLQQHYAHLATTYALFYDQFSNRDAIDRWLVEWGTRYERTRPLGVSNCPFPDPFMMKNAKIKGTKYQNASGCGSKKWRGSVARITLGLRLKNQALYLSGVRQLEALLGMFDRNGIYVHYATRGWDSIGYAIDVPEYLSNIALAFDSIGYDFYSLKTNSGYTVGELVAKTNAWLANPKLAEEYYIGTRNERPGEQPTFFRNVKDYGGYDQWRQERQSEDHDILFRSFHYLYRMNPEELSPSPISKLNEVKRRVYGRDLPEMYFFGWNTGVPQILSVLDKTKINWNRHFPHNFPYNGLTIVDVEDLRKEVEAEWDKLTGQNDFDLNSFINPSMLTKYKAPPSNTISFDVYYMESSNTRGDYGMSGYIDRKEPFTVYIEDGKVYLSKNTHVADGSPGDILGSKDGDMLNLSFKGNMCDNCPPENVEIIVSLPLMAGVSANATKEGHRLVLLPLP